MRIAFLTWRDTGHPDGGGSERYVEEIARRLAAQGHQVTILCARYPGSRADSWHDGVRFRRSGGRLTVYPRGLLWLLGREGRRQDRVVEVINGIPFGARLLRRRGLVALVHHLHREQWELIYPGLLGRAGWWVESRLTPRLYAGVPHITVSEASRSMLRELGIRQVDVVRNGLSRPTVGADRSPEPRLCALARLVPHKQLEHAIDALAELRRLHPGLELDLIGDGWWAERLHRHARARGVHDAVVWHGRVGDERRDELLGRAWVALLPSAREGWGLAIVEAAAMGTPTIAYRAAGGPAEAILDGVSGLLVDGPEELAAAAHRVLSDPTLRETLSEGARRRSAEFDWDRTAALFARRLA